ncbi:hypothetical protein H8N03_25430 [Ramlibacter sp. USB13]|uniref:Uncharacterized protein n=1 Tax=Ramlibacter cellulosilyticus TaxID=2764187 RepID=A0A923MVS9_9BURK|nr:hypothetical protein [Ramlibacter cellulosilyticus]MBC5786305.1 hypothetical protein [Ramlibacter cellulosilyticus]
MKIAFVAAACMLAASAFAQSNVSSSTGVTVTSGTGVVVTPGAPSASVTVMPSTVSTVTDHALLPGGAMVQRSSTTVLGGPAPGVSGTKTEITTYWANVPADASRDASFQRWQRLK